LNRPTQAADIVVQKDRLAALYGQLRHQRGEASSTGYAIYQCRAVTEGLSFEH